MTKYEFGDVCTADFPYEEDISTVERRPVIVVTGIDDKGFLNCMMITSKGPKKIKGEVELSDYKIANLKVRSFARVDRITKINKNQVYKKIGRLSSRDTEKILEELRTL